MDDVVIEMNGYSVKTPHWSRTVTEKRIPTSYGNYATVIDFDYETNLVFGNQEWFVRMKSPIDNKGIFHTVSALVRCFKTRQFDYSLLF